VFPGLLKGVGNAVELLVGKHVIGFIGTYEELVTVIASNVQKKNIVSKCLLPLLPNVPRK
jgi:hypothetical protein